MREGKIGHNAAGLATQAPAHPVDMLVHFRNPNIQLVKLLLDQTVRGAYHEALCQGLSIANTMQSIIWEIQHHLPQAGNLPTVDLCQT